MKAYICKACGTQEATNENNRVLGGKDLGLEIAGYVDECVLCLLINIDANDFVEIMAGA